MLFNIACSRIQLSLYIYICSQPSLVSTNLSYFCSLPSSLLSLPSFLPSFYPSFVRSFLRSFVPTFLPSLASHLPSSSDLLFHTRPSPHSISRDLDLFLNIFHLTRSLFLFHLSMPSLLFFSLALQGTTRLLDLARHYGCANFVYASSSSVYGSSTRYSTVQYSISSYTVVGRNILQFRITLYITYIVISYTL